jgi:hypothetical protein
MAYCREVAARKGTQMIAKLDPTDPVVALGSHLAKVKALSDELYILPDEEMKRRTEIMRELGLAADPKPFQAGEVVYINAPFVVVGRDDNSSFSQDIESHDCILVRPAHSGVAEFDQHAHTFPVKRQFVTERSLEWLKPYVEGS